MKTTVGKVLSVATAVASVIFAGFVFVATLGGPNWVAQANAIPGYAFTRAEVAPYTWSAKADVGEGNIPGSPTIESVISAVYNAKIQKVTADTQKLNEAVPGLQAKADQSLISVKADLTALDAQVAELTKLLNETEQESLSTAKAVEAKAEEIRKVELQIQSRREDVLRLSAQVDEIRTDRFRIAELQQQMRDLIQQIDGSLERAERRQAQLKSQL